MDNNSIKQLIARGEGVRVEFKSSFNQDAIVTLNAFVNTEGGKVLIGVNDDGSPVGKSIGKEDVQKWINEVKSKTEPCIVPDEKLFKYKGKDVVVLSVKEYPVKPVSVQGRYYKRVKNSNHRLSLSEISDLYLETFHSSWDYYIDNQHQLDDISTDKVNAFLSKRYGGTSESDPLRALQKYELIRDGQLTNAAFLLFVKDYTPLTGIEAARFKSPVKIIDAVSIHSDLFSEVDAVEAFIRKHLMTEYIHKKDEFRRKEQFDYPEEAIREIVLNMIVHRNYRDSGDSIIKIFDDRIEFFNPGNLPDNLTVEKLLSDDYTPKSRNTLINAMFKEARLVEKYGLGIKHIMDACAKHGGCNVQFFNEQHGFKVVLSKKDGKSASDAPSTREKNEDSGDSMKNADIPSDITVREKEILNLVKKNGKISLHELAEQLSTGRSTIVREMEKLKSKGLLEREGPDRGGSWKAIENENE